MGVKNALQLHRSHRNHITYKGEPLDKKYLREVGGGEVINRIKESGSPSVEITFQGLEPLGKSLIGLPGL